MQLRSLIVLTHAASAAIGGAAIGVHTGHTGGLATWTATIVAVMSLVPAWWLTERLRAGFGQIEDALANPQREADDETGIRELQRLVDRIRTQARRWASSAATAEQQTRQIQQLVGKMDRRLAVDRTGSGLSAGSRLEELLGGMTRAAETDLQQALTYASEIAESSQHIAGGTQEQSEAVNKATTYVEQMSVNIDSVSQNADAASEAAVSVRESAGKALDLVRELITGMDRIRLHVEASGKRLRALGDRSHEIGSIVETIGTIAARTDMLALNASIESVRAGENGRGFAVVAEEVRKLAEQAAQATREVAVLIEAVQAETQESIDVMGYEHAQVEQEVRRVNEAGVALEQISTSSSDSAQRVGEISRAMHSQLRFTQEVVMAMERISEVAKGIRAQSDAVSRSTRTLTDQTRQLARSLSPLRGCATGRLDPLPEVTDGIADPVPRGQSADPADTSGRPRQLSLAGQEA